MTVLLLMLLVEYLQYVGQVRESKTEDFAELTFVKISTLSKELLNAWLATKNTEFDNADVLRFKCRKALHYNNILNLMTSQDSFQPHIAVETSQPYKQRQGFYEALFYLLVDFTYNYTGNGYCFFLSFPGISVSE